jgi:hypothetical protein
MSRISASYLGALDPCRRSRAIASSSDAADQRVRESRLREGRFLAMTRQCVWKPMDLAAPLFSLSSMEFVVKAVGGASRIREPLLRGAGAPEPSVAGREAFPRFTRDVTRCVEQRSEMEHNRPSERKREGAATSRKSSPRAWAPHHLVSLQLDSAR